MANTLDKIQFHYLHNSFHFKKRREVKAFLLKSLSREGRKVEAINYIFCDDAYLFQINKQYLNHDTFTDIVTFELSPKLQPLVADIYISVERVKENASIFKTSFFKELHRVIFHGALHLCGFKDKTKEQAAVMRRKEDELLQLYFSRGTSKGKKD